MTQAQRGTTARVVKKLLPQEAGARKWAAEFGGRLLCVRYRVDPQSQRRQTTVELVVEEAPTLASARVGVRLAWAETDLRRSHDLCDLTLVWRPLLATSPCHADISKNPVWADHKGASPSTPPETVLRRPGIQATSR